MSRHHHQFRRIFTLLVFLLGAATNLCAVQDPVTARGFAADKVYHFNGLDTVDQFNGNLMIAIPIGDSFKSNGSLQYGLTLQYNSNVWDHQELAYYLHASGSTVLECDEFNWWGGGCFGEDAQYRGTEGYPGRLFNAGLGWSLGLGSIRGFTYLSPDGAEHHFFDKLHGNVTAARPAGADLYTRDATYLRMKNTAASGKLTVEFPNGLQHRFVCLANCGDANRAEYVLDQMADPYGNILYVTRSTEPSAPGGEWTWTLHEKVSSAAGYADHTAAAALTSVRTHKIVFERDLYSAGKYRIARVELDGFGDAVATYTFHYSHKQIYRSHESTWGGPQGRFPLTVDPVDKLTLSMLDSVELPAGAGSYRFLYVLEPEAEGYANDLKARSVQVEGPLQKWTTSHYAGRLATMTLPAGGGIGYEYGQRRFFRRQCHGGVPTPALDAIGIRKRFLIGNNAGDRPWLYFADSYDIANDCNGPREFASTVIDPSGNATATYFWVFAGSAADPTGGDDYGLPVTHDQPAHDGRLLSTRVYQCPFAQLATLFDGADAFTNARKIHQQYLRSGETGTTCGQPLRSTYVQYENSGKHCRDDSPTGCVQANRRTRAESTKYHDDGDAATWTIHGDFDGLGHYRTTTTGGNLFGKTFPDVAGGDERIVTTRYNPSVTFDPATFAINLPARWLLDTYDRVVTTERENGSTDAQKPASTKVVKTRFNAQTGFLEEKRILLGEGTNADDNSPKDLIVRFARTRTPAEALVSVRETYFGGDTGTKLEPAASDAEFAIERISQYGGLRKAAYLDCSQMTDFLVIESNEVDPGTGLIRKSTDMSNLATSYAYDALGRLTSVTPAGLAPTTYTYTTASGNTKAAVTAETKSGATVLRKSEVRFDGFGRIAEERTVLPDENGQPRDSVRETKYYANGNTWKISTLGGNTPSAHTIFEKYDPFGRVVRVTSPDGFTTETSYKGVREEKATVTGLALATGFGGSATEVSRIARHDRFGRIVELVEDSDTNSSGGVRAASTRYQYDVHGELWRVFAAGQNTREFERDKRGLVIAEQHPELANAVLRYQNYDARGNFRSRILRQPSNPSTAFDLLYQYDAAERPTVIRRAADKHPLKTFNYHGSGNGAKGKLKTATRANFIPDPLAVEQTIELGVTQRFDYHDTTGLLRQTTLNAPRFQATVGYTYDGLGNVKSVAYPRFENICAGCAPQFPARSVAYEYKYGVLTAIPGWVTSIHYHRNGAWSELRRANSAVDSQSIAPNNLPRPLSIAADFAGDRRKIGPYAYDAAGNVSRIGTNTGPDDTFGYDRVGRIATATIRNITEAFSYDRYGNLTRLGNQALSPVAATNRLSDALYDLAGNLRERNWSDGTVARYTYDPFNMMTHHVEAIGNTTRQGKVFLYDAADERVAVADYVAAAPKMVERWSVRDASGRVLREGTRDGQGAWRYDDYIHRDGTVLAQVHQPAPGAAEDVRHFHHDHLGSVRFVSDATGKLADQRKFLAFGAEINQHPDVNHFKFTGHERDDDGTGNQYDDLDYLHARYYSAVVGRFFSVDPEQGTSRLPQSWNRYAYVRNNPVSLIDPTGREDDEKRLVAERTREAQEAREAQRKRMEEARDPENQAARGNGLNEPGTSTPAVAVLMNQKTGQVSGQLPPTDAEVPVANFVAGVGEGSQGSTLINAIVGALGLRSDDLQRKQALVDTASKAYNAGASAGMIGVSIAGGHVSDVFFPKAKPPAPTPRIPPAPSKGNPDKWH